VEKLTKDEQLTIFRKVCGSKRVVTNIHTNIANGNYEKDGFFNQGVSKVKLKEYKENEKLDLNFWKTVK